MQTMNIKQMADEGYMYVQNPQELRNAVEAAEQAWRAFCGLPLKDKLATFPYEADAKVSGNGYEMKMTPGETLDLKEDFHIRKSVGDTFLARARASGHPEALRFVEAAIILPDLIAPILNDFALEAESEFGMAGFAEDVRKRTSTMLLRFLHYFPNHMPGADMASQHVDKGGFTLHLYESDAGVQRLVPKGTWVELPVSHDETVLIPGMRMQYRSEGQLKALCHRVVATEESAEIGRFSAVCFVGFDGTPYYDKDTQGRLQDKPAGFNHDMPFEKFKELFID
ncbi:MAG: hypothetical protein JWL88_241 [Parcubacteria group bacterium]|nr:hypothetical protein [Parcubacteria group bacterium]